LDVPHEPVKTRCRWRLPAEAAMVPYVRAGVTVLATDLTEDDLYRIRLALTEACANVVRHAYPGAPGDVLCECEVTEHEVVIRVSDWGVGWDQPSAHPGLGLGIPLIERLSDHATQTHSQGITLMEMRFARRGELAAKIR